MAIKHNLIYGDVSANDYGIFISGEGVYNAPSRNVETVEVPGRNGSLTIDQGSYTNITIEYPAFTFATSQAQFRRKLNAFKNAIMSQVGYQRLWDDYHPDDYREALYIEGLEVDPVQLGRAGSFTLTFNCKPQRYLTSGQEEVTVTNNTIVNNPTLYDAEPLLMVKGYGTIAFNGYEVEIANAQIGVVEAPREVSLINIPTTPVPTIYDYGDKFANGDTLKLAIYACINATSTASSAPSSYTETTSGDLTPSTYYTDFTGTSGKGITIEATFDELTYTVGTLDSGSFEYLVDVGIGGETASLKLSVTVAFDGKSKFNVAVRYTNVNSYANVYFNNATLRVNGFDAVSTLQLLGDPTYIDCEIGEAYRYKDDSVISLNSYIDLGSDLPKLASGQNTFTVDNTITELIVVPRYWQL